MSLAKSLLPASRNTDISLETLLSLIPPAIRKDDRFYGHPYHQADMEELAQSIVLSLIKNDSRGLHSFQHISRETTWLQKVVNHAVLRFFLSQKNTISLDDITPDDFLYEVKLDEEILTEERKGAITAILKQSPKREQILFALLSQEIEASEIATRLGVTISHVYVIKQRLFKKLIDSLNAEA